MVALCYNPSTMTIAVLGGRFDPPHIGHLLVSRQILEKRPDIQEVWLIPAAQHQWKKAQASAEDRLKMLSLLQSEKIKISDIEITRGGISYSIDTIRTIRKRYGHNVYWIIGADILPELPRWENAAALTDETTFLVFPRDPYAITNDLPKGFEIVTGDDLITTNISSTAVRKLIKKNLPITYLVPQEIENFIKTHHLYEK